MLFFFFSLQQFNLFKYFSFARIQITEKGESWHHNQVWLHGFGCSFSWFNKKCGTVSPEGVFISCLTSPSNQQFIKPEIKPDLSPRVDLCSRVETAGFITSYEQLGSLIVRKNTNYDLGKWLPGSVREFYLFIYFFSVTPSGINAGHALSSQCSRNLRRWPLKVRDKFRSASAKHEVKQLLRNPTNTAPWNLYEMVSNAECKGETHLKILHNSAEAGWYLRN